MIGCIVTGHGEFSTGMKSAVEMIAGIQESFEAVVFREEETLEAFEEHMEQTLQKLLVETDGVVIFADLLGGTPFRTAMLAANNQTNVEVVAGVNLPLVIESVGLRSIHQQTEELLTAVMTIGKEGIVHGKFALSTSTKKNAEEEGI